MNWTLEVVVVPVSDIDRAKEFYSAKAGFSLDHDTSELGRPGPRIVQLTPPGSGCSIVLGDGITGMAPGSLQGLQLVVRDLRAAHAELVSRGVPVSDIQVMGGQGPLTQDTDLNNAGFIFFADPDGNHWAVQQISNRSLRPG